MKKQLALVLALALAAGVAVAADPSKEIKLDFSDLDTQHAEFRLEGRAADTYTVRAWLYVAGRRYVPQAGDGFTLGFATSGPPSIQVSPILGSNTLTNAVDFVVGASNLPVAGGFFSQVLYTNNLGHSVVWAEGKAAVKANPLGGGNTAWALQTPVNWSSVRMTGTPPWSSQMGTATYDTNLNGKVDTSDDFLSFASAPPYLRHDGANRLTADANGGQYAWTNLDRLYLNDPDATWPAAYTVNEYGLFFNGTSLSGPALDSGSYLDAYGLGYAFAPSGSGFVFGTNSALANAYGFRNANGLLKITWGNAITGREVMRWTPAGTASEFVFDGSIHFARSNEYDIGSLAAPVRHLFLGPNSLYMGPTNAGVVVWSYTNGAVAAGTNLNMQEHVVTNAGDYVFAGGAGRVTPGTVSNANAAAAGYILGDASTAPWRVLTNAEANLVFQWRSPQGWTNAIAIIGPSQSVGALAMVGGVAEPEPEVEASPAPQVKRKGFFRRLFGVDASKR